MKDVMANFVERGDRAAAELKRTWYSLEEVLQEMREMSATRRQQLMQHHHSKRNAPIHGPGGRRSKAHTRLPKHAAHERAVILGLDFDGVLHPVNDTRTGRFCRLPLLAAGLREHPKVDVVVTSSWRQAHSLQALRSLFAEDLRVRLVGSTPLAHRFFGPSWCRTAQERAPARYERQAELEAWMLEALNAGPWIALDDNPAPFLSRDARTWWSVSRKSASPPSGWRRCRIL